MNVTRISPKTSPSLQTSTSHQPPQTPPPTPSAGLRTRGAACRHPQRSVAVMVDVGAPASYPSEMATKRTMPICAPTWWVRLPRCMDIISAEDVISRIEGFLGAGYFRRRIVPEERFFLDACALEPPAFKAPFLSPHPHWDLENSLHCKEVPRKRRARRIPADSPNRAAIWLDAWTAGTSP